jgi:hypothetical protein
LRDRCLPKNSKESFVAKINRDQPQQYNSASLVTATTTSTSLTDLLSVLLEKILVRKPLSKRGVNKGTVLRVICTEIGCKSKEWINLPQ